MSWLTNFYASTIRHCLKFYCTINYYIVSKTHILHKYIFRLMIIKCLLWISIADRCLNEDYNNTVFLHNTMEDSNVQYSSDEKIFTAYKKFRSFNCSDRHVLTYGFLTLECQLGGQWNGTAPVCNGEGLAFSLINNLHNYKLYKCGGKGGGVRGNPCVWWVKCGDIDKMIQM